MKCFVFTCKRYETLVDGFLWLWKRYVGLDIEVACGAMDVPWCRFVSSTISKVDDPEILLVLEDYYMLQKVDMGRVERLRGELSKGADKADLQRQVNHWPHTEEADGLVVANQNAQYRASTQAAIWKREYLLNKLRQGGNPWEFELWCDAMNDGARIVGLKESTMVYANVMFKGQPDPSQVNLIDKLDWQAMLAEKELTQKKILNKWMLEARQ